jgi:hypothetical protein
MSNKLIVFNLVGAIAATLLVLGLCSTWFLILPMQPPEMRGLYHVVAALYAISSTLVGLGTILQIYRGRFSVGTLMMIIAGYCAALWTFPLAIWGIVVLMQENRRLPDGERGVRPCSSDQT